jgi:hypothetical protein
VSTTTYDRIIKNGKLVRELTVTPTDGDLFSALTEAKRLAIHRIVSLVVDGVRVPISTKSTPLGVIMYAGKRTGWQ